MRSYAEKCGMPYVNERWLGGMLTNFDTISKRVGKMLEYERMRDSGEFEAMPKKEALLLTRELEKLQRNLGGLRGMTKRPDAIFVLDTKKEHIAVTEANKLGIPVVAVVDTNVDPELVQYPIPGNDDAIRANSLLARVIADAVEEGRFIAAKRDPAGAAGRRARAEEEAAFDGPAGRGPPRGRRPRRPRASAGSPSARRRAADEPEVDDADAASRRRRAESTRSTEPDAGRGRRAPRPLRRTSRRQPRPSRQPTDGTGRRAAEADRCRRRSTEPAPTTATETGELNRHGVHRQGRPGAAPGDRRRDDGRQAGPRGHRRRHRGRQAVAARAGPAASAKRDDRENTQGVVALVVDGRSAPSSS